MQGELIVALQDSADTLRELRDCQHQRDELLSLAEQMCGLLESLVDGYPSEALAIEGFRSKLAALARASNEETTS